MSFEAANMVIGTSRPHIPGVLINYVGRKECASLEGVV